MRRVVALLIIVVSAAAAACGGGDDDARARLPPNRRQAIAEPFAAELDELGVRVTRAAVVDRETGRPGPNARHLAVYVEPTGPYSPDDFAGGIATIARVFLPDAFDRWPGLASFDVCQEPIPGVDDRRVPPPKTQIDISRAMATKVDWATADLETVLTLATEDDEDAFTVFADAEVMASTTFQARAPAGFARTSDAAAPTEDARY